MNRNHVGEGGGAMRIECPHCRVSIDVVDETPDSDVTGPSCGSRIERQLARAPSPYPTLKVARRPASIFGYELEDFQLVDYQHHPAIKAPVAV